MNNQQCVMDYENYSMAKGRESEVLSNKSPFKLHRSHSVSDEADMLAKAISQASAAAKSILKTGGSLETASSTAKAAASSVLSPSRSAMSGISGRHLLSRRHARRQAEIIAAMALVSAKKEIDDQERSATRAFVADAQRDMASSTHTATGGISSNIHPTVPNSNASLIKNARGILPQLAAPLFQSDTDTDAGSEADWPAAPPKNEREHTDPSKESASERKTFSKQVAAHNEKPKEQNEGAQKITSQYFRRKKLTNNPSDEESEMARRSAAANGSIIPRKQEETPKINTANRHHPTAGAPEGSYYEICSYDERSEDISYDRTSEASFAEERSSSQNVTETVPSSEDDCLMSSLAFVFSCRPAKVPNSRPSLSTFTQEARDDQVNKRNLISRESRVDRKDEESNDTQDILRELNASRHGGPRSKTITSRPSPLRDSMEKIVMGVLTTPTVASSHKKVFHQRIIRGGRQPVDANLSNASTDGASEISTFSRASRIRLWSGRRKKVEQPE